LGEIIYYRGNFLFVKQENFMMALRKIDRQTKAIENINFKDYVWILEEKKSHKPNPKEHQETYNDQ